MKTLKNIFYSLLALSMAGAMTSCNDSGSDEPQNPVYMFTPAQYSNLSYTPEGYWSDVYSSSAVLRFNGLDFSHTGNAEYRSWTGFCPSRSTDNSNHNGDYQYQWGSIVGSGANSQGSAYMVGYWDTMETTTSIPANPSCKICLYDTDNKLYPFKPLLVSVTNTAYSYYAMADGTPFNKQFTNTDEFILIAIGVKNNIETNRINIPLAKDGGILRSWYLVDLAALGKVDYVYFQMKSTDMGEWGMNNPSYFCIDNFIYEL